LSPLEGESEMPDSVSLIFALVLLLNVILNSFLLDFTSVQIPSSAWTLLVGRQEGHPACITLGVGLLVVTI